MNEGDKVKFAVRSQGQDDILLEGVIINQVMQAGDPAMPLIENEDAVYFVEATMPDGDVWRGRCYAKELTTIS